MYKKFTKEQRSTFSYWFYHWKAFNELAIKLGVWKFHHLFHDIEKPFLRLFMDYKKVQKFHRKHNAHHLEYQGRRNWLDMYLDWECSRYTKVESPRTAVEEANLKLENGTMSYNDYCEFMRVARNMEQREKTPHRHDVEMINANKKGCTRKSDNQVFICDYADFCSRSTGNCYKSRKDYRKRINKNKTE